MKHLLHLKFAATLLLLTAVFLAAFTTGSYAAYLVLFIGCAALAGPQLSPNLCANALTISALTENLFQARDTVARELVGFIPSMTVNGGSEGVSLGGTVNSMVTATPTVNSSITPAMTIPAADDQTITAETMTIGQTANVRIPINGEKFKQLAATVGENEALTQMFAQAMRGIVNTIEAHCGTVLKNGSSRATGTAGTTPFASTHDILVDARQILADNGAPVNNDGMLSAILNTAAGAKLRKLSNLYKANEAGGTNLLRNGELLNLFGISLKESAGVASHTAGTGASGTTNNAGYAIGATSLTLASAGTGTLVAGDVVTFAGDTANKYVAYSGDTDVSDAGTLVLNKPGLRVAMSAATKAITVGAAYTANMLFHKAAAELVMRPPAQPPGGDAADDSMTIFDPVSGLVFAVALYRGYKMNMIDISVYYQAKVWKPDFVATILG